MVFQIAAGGESGTGAVTDGRGKLADFLGPAVAGREDAGRSGQCAFIRVQISFGIGRDHTVQEFVLRLLANSQKYSLEGLVMPFSGPDILKPQSGDDPFFRQICLRDGIIVKADIALCSGFFHQFFVRAEGIPAVDQGNAFADPGKEKSVLKGGIAAADHRHVLPGA